MVNFIVGLFIGGWLGVISMAMCAAAGRDDELNGRK